MIRRHHKKSTIPRRRGFTLIHTLVTITIMSILLSITISAMITVMNRNQTVYFTSLHYKNINRFSLEFRNDIHQAKSVSFIEEENETGILINKPDEEKTKYVSNGDTIYRLNENRDGKKSRDEYRFLPETDVEFLEEAPSTVEVAIRNPYTSENSRALPEGYLPRKEIRILAYKGRDHRFLVQEEETPNNN